MYFILRNDDGTMSCVYGEDIGFIPCDDSNTDWLNYQLWLADGNEPKEWADR